MASNMTVLSTKIQLSDARRQSLHAHTSRHCLHGLFFVSLFEMEPASHIFQYSLHLLLDVAMLA